METQGLNGTGKKLNRWQNIWFARNHICTYVNFETVEKPNMFALCKVHTGSCTPLKLHSGDFRYKHRRQKQQLYKVLKQKEQEVLELN